MSKYCCLIVMLVLAVALCQVEGGRRSGGGRGGRNRSRNRNRMVPEDAVLVATWTRVLPSEVEHNETAFKKDPLVYFHSSKAGAGRSGRNGFKPSFIVYDFSASPAMAVMKVKRKCFLMPQPQFSSFEELVNHITPFNGVRRDSNNDELTLYVTNMTAEETTQLESRTDLASVCSGRGGVQKLTTEQPSVQGKQKQQTVAGLDNILKVTKVKPARARGGGGRRSGGGGRRRGRNGQGQ